jgi:hypothetical protein
MVSNRFSLHSAHSSLETFHHIKQTTTVIEYIQKFEELMVMMQLDYPGLNEAYFINSFIAGMKEGIKHYLISHSPNTLCDTYWKAKEFENGILVKKSLMNPNTTYLKPNPTLPLAKQPQATQPLNQPPPKPIPIKPREQGKC